MFEDEYEFDYDRVIQDTDELYDEDFYTDEDYHNTDEPEYGYYYHNLMNELDND